MKNLNIKRMVIIAVMACTPLLVTSQLTKVSSDGSVTLVQHFNDMFNGRGLVDTSVQAAKTKSHNFAFVGYIVGSAGGSMYEFKDDSGKGFVEITDFGGLKVGPGDKVWLKGGAEFDDGVLYLKVDQIKKGN